MESIYNKGNDQSLLLIAKNFFVAHERTFVDTPVFWKDGETESTNLKKDSGVNFGQTGFLVDWRTKVRLFPVQDVLGFSLSAIQLGMKLLLRSISILIYFLMSDIF